MKIDHIALYSNQIEVIKDFYIRYFGAHSNKLYQNEKTGLRTYFLSFAEGARMEIMTRPGIMDDDNNKTYSGYTHIALSVADDDEVDKRTADLAQYGVTILSHPRRTGDGYYESVILDPDGNHIEIVSAAR